MAGTGAQRAGAREAAPRYDDNWMQVQEDNRESDDDGDTDTEADADGEDKDGADADQDSAAAAEDRPDIQARLRRVPGVIVAETWANRAQRTRVPRDIYQAGTKKGLKKPGRGREGR